MSTSKSLGRNLPKKVSLWFEFLTKAFPRSIKFNWSVCCLCICSIMTLFSLDWVTVARKYILIIRNELKERSLEALVEGMTNINQASLHIWDNSTLCEVEVLLKYRTKIIRRNVVRGYWPSLSAAFPVGPSRSHPCRISCWRSILSQNLRYWHLLQEDPLVCSTLCNQVDQSMPLWQKWQDPELQSRLMCKTI